MQSRQRIFVTQLNHLKLTHAQGFLCASNNTRRIRRVKMTSFNRQLNHSRHHRIFGSNLPGARPLLLTFLCLGILGCGSMSLADRPEFAASQWAPASVDHAWTPLTADRAALGSDTRAASGVSFNAAHITAGKTCDLSALINLALATNPATRADWQAARSAAYDWAHSRAPYYPLINVNSQSGYERLVDQVPKHWGTFKNWQSTNLLSLNYDLIDFGRRDATSASARGTLLAANFVFNRSLQTVVFNVERAFYLFDASRAQIRAAQAVVRLATTDRRAVQRRHDLGLVNGPDLLLARQREAQAEYDLQNVELAMRDAQADLALALGLDPTRLPQVASFTSQPLPATLAPAIDELLRRAVADRPDLAAQAARLQGKRAEVALAHADMYPTLGASAYYGSHAFDYGLSNPPTPYYGVVAPEYAATLTLKWDLFAGFAKVNAIGEAQAARDQAQADLDQTALQVASEVWRAYYAFQTAMEKYQYAKTLLQASQSSYDSNYKSFGRGLINIIDLLAAERDLAAANYTIIQSRADVLVAAASVAYATGAISASSSK
jgi:outer membrane protein